MIVSVVPLDSAHGSNSPQLEAAVAGPFEVVSDWKKDRCDPKETFDAPPRAFRDFEGQVHLEASHDTWRENLGPSLSEVAHKCNIIFRSLHANDPKKLADYQWLVAPYTSDGKRIDIIIHNEFHARGRLDICPSQIFLRCWSNSLTYAHSEDGGKSIIQREAPFNFVAGLPYQYTIDVGYPVGYFQPSNIVYHQGYYYVLFTATAYLRQAAGTCIMRTQHLDDPTSWRAWDGKDFTVKFVDPYAEKPERPEEHLCTPLSKRLGVMGGMAFDPKTMAFVLVTKGAVTGTDKKPLVGIVAMASYDLIDWSDPILLWSDPSGAKSMSDPLANDLDPTILAPDSESRNFDVIKGLPYVYFVRADRRAFGFNTYDRQLLRVPVSIRVKGK